jgi:hypothetical protein
MKLKINKKIVFQVCQAAVGVVGDLGRNIGIKILPYCDELMTILLEGLIVIMIFFYKVE